MGRHFKLFFLLVLWALLMSWNVSSLPPVAINGITDAGVAIQFAHGQQDLEKIFGSNGSCTEGSSCADIKSALLCQQILDVVFIVLYWLFFFQSLARPLCRFGRKQWQWVGWAARACITLAALAELTENFAIDS
jgi:hypothetical protein